MHIPIPFVYSMQYVYASQQPPSNEPLLTCPVASCGKKAEICTETFSPFLPRGVCMMACGPDPRWQGVLTVPYQTATDTFHVGPCQYERMDSVARQMQAMDDRDLLCLTSTSPTSEGSEFLPATRKVLSFLIEHPNWWDVFPFDQPRVFIRTKAGGWKRTA